MIGGVRRAVRWSALGTTFGLSDTHRDNRVGDGLINVGGGLAHGRASAGLLPPGRHAHACARAGSPLPSPPSLWIRGRNAGAVQAGGAGRSLRDCLRAPLFLDASLPAKTA